MSRPQLPQVLVHDEVGSPLAAQSAKQASLGVSTLPQSLHVSPDIPQVLLQLDVGVPLARQLS